MSTMKILIGYDGSKCADAALIDLQRAGLPEQAEVTILSATDVFLPPKADNETNPESFPPYVPYEVKLARERAGKSFAEAEKLSIRAREKIIKSFPAWTVNAEACADSPHWAIINKSRELKPDLIVVGSHGRNALGRFFLGSVSQKVLYETSTPVRIARGRDLPADEPVKLVLGTDGSADSRAMVETVAGRNWKKGTQIKIVTAFETYHQNPVEPDIQISRIRDIQETALEKLDKNGFEVTALITDEDPKQFLVREAEKWNADCIFLGAKGHRFFERLLVGSISSAIAVRAHCSVEVVRKIVDE